MKEKVIVFIHTSFLDFDEECPCIHDQYVPMEASVEAHGEHIS